MAYPTKIATCCYCSTRAALVLRGRDRHELACSNCGAPLHDLKMLPKKSKAAKGDRELVKPSALRAQPPKKSKKRKSRWGDFFEEAFDLIEDILD
ncbi:hypothetical protein [uncultured Tateyamaria sp.]|uniref:hypothetical protein n=1 Tax=uncultured Tateyamaria sp. TaxID=455651 RepID=UPI002621BB41|nr:hypothetical protein [uncultured Tateyamaria sp.]